MSAPYAGKVVIATPFYNLQAYSTYCESLVATCRILEKLGIEHDFMPLHGDSYVGRARNTLCAKFLADAKATDLFFIDSDESWDVMGFMRVLMAPGEIVGGSYRMKNNWGEWTAKYKQEFGFPKGVEIRPGEALLEADALPCGFMKIQRGALEKFKAAYPELKYHDIGSDPTVPNREYFAFFCTDTAEGIYEGEDYVFCRRWRAIGGRMWIEPNVSITHHGVTGYGGNLDTTLREQRKAMDEAKRRTAEAAANESESSHAA